MRKGVLSTPARHCRVSAEGGSDKSKDSAQLSLGQQLRTSDLSSLCKMGRLKLQF
jgi:hypothetical protein